MIMQHLEQLSDIAFYASRSVFSDGPSGKHGMMSVHASYHAQNSSAIFSGKSCAKAEHAMGAHFPQQIHLGMLGCRSE